MRDVLYRDGIGCHACNLTQSVDKLETPDWLADGWFTQIFDGSTSGLTGEPTNQPTCQLQNRLKNYSLFFVPASQI